ncbi:MAG: PAS domain S-box protein [Chloroflexi bacterium]|nr:PAS domain S-box protein [Chloroflexota bacterium]
MSTNLDPLTQLQRENEALRLRVQQLEESLRLVGRQTAIPPQGSSADRLRQVHDELAHRESLLRATLYSIGDAVIATDTRGQVTMMNRVAEALTGWEEVEAQARPLSDIFRIINEQSRATVENPVGQALRQGVVIGLANHTLLLARDGREHPIADAAAPILGADGRIAGVVLIFRDQTAERQAQQALEKAKENLERAEQQAGLGSWHLDAGSGQGYWSQQMFRLYDLEPDDTPPAFADYLDRIHPEDRHLVQAALDDMIAGREPEDREFRTNPARATLRYLRPTWHCTYHADGRPMTFSGTLLDITNQKQSAEALVSSKQSYMDIFNTVSEAIYIQREDGVFIDVNKGAEVMYGFSRDELIGQTPAFISAPDRNNLPRILHLLQQVAATGRPVMFEFWGRRKNGELFLKEVIVNKGKYFGQDVLIATARDISERKKAEEAREQLLAQVAQQVQQVQGIMDTVPQGVFLLDNHNRVVQANPAAQRNLADLASIALGQPLTHLGDHLLEDLLTSPAKGLWHEVRAEERTFEVIARPMAPGLGSEGWVMALREVTEQRWIEEQLRQHERLAAVGQLAAGIAHDFNNLLAIIMLHTDLLAATISLPPKGQKQLAIIEQQTKRATQLIQQILDFSRQASLATRPLDLLHTLQEETKLLRRTLPEHVQIDLYADPGDYLVEADLTRIQQVILNLAVNARDAMPDGGRLTFRLTHLALSAAQEAPLPTMHPGHWIHLAVSDSGAGIEPDVIRHIFEPFFTTKGPGKGVGLGLAQVHGIVGQHNGHINITSQVGKGATFDIYLPALVLQNNLNSRPPADTALSRPGARLLIVEDDAMLRSALADSLRLWQYEVWEAANGLEALASLAQGDKPMDLILSDVIMPHMGGVALIQALRQQGWQTPVIFMSGHPLDMTLPTLRTVGAAAILNKPIDPVHLNQTITAVLAGE